MSLPGPVGATRIIGIAEWRESCGVGWDRCYLARERSLNVLSGL